MYRLKILNRMRMLYVPAAIVAGATTTVTIISTSSRNPVFAADAPAEDECDPNKPLVRSRDLPIYFQPDGKIHKEPKAWQDPNEVYPDDKLMDVVKTGRQVLLDLHDKLDSAWALGVDEIRIGRTHTEDALQQLRDPENVNVQYAAIAGGGLFGFICSLRGGIIKKFFYTSAGATAMASLCYPDLAKEYFNEVLAKAEEYGSVAYHFFNAAIKDLTGIDFQTASSITTIVSIDSIKSLLFSKDDSEVSKTSPTSASLLPPATETPSHLKSSSTKSGENTKESK